MEEKNPIQSAERIFRVLEALTTTGPIGLVQLSEHLQLHKSTVHRLLVSLTMMGYVRQRDEDGKYMPTFKIVQLAEQLMAKVDVVSLLHGTMAELANQVSETVHLVQRIGNHVVYIDKVEPMVMTLSAIRMASQVGMNRPMYCSGVGKAILAELTSAEVDEIWGSSEIEKKTEHTIVTIGALRKELAVIRDSGYAMDNEENELGVRCIAVNIMDAKGTPEYAMSISAPVSRMEDARVGELYEALLQAKLKMQQLLGVMQ